MRVFGRPSDLTPVNLLRVSMSLQILQTSRGIVSAWAIGSDGHRTVIRQRRTLMAAEPIKYTVSLEIQYRHGRHY
jgi:hypothetical protein